MSVRKLGNRWWFDVWVRGERHRSPIPEARTKYQAKESERKIRDQIFEGTYGTVQSRKTLKEFANETFLPWSKANKRSWRDDQYRLKPIIAHFGSKKMSDITPFAIERYKIERSKGLTSQMTTRSRTTVNRELQLLSRIFTLAIASREVSSNPVSKEKLFKGEVRRTRYLLPDEEEKLMAQLTGERAHLRLIVLIALHTGMRRGEIFRLKKSDVDFYRGEIRIILTKNDEARAVPMNETLRFELAGHIGGLESEYLFANPKTGKPRGDIKNAFTTACKNAEIEGLRFHDLRHTAATRMAEAGIDPFTIAAILGHKSIAMTASYSHATQQAKRRAVAALESGPQMGHKVEQRPLRAAVSS